MITIPVLLVTVRVARGRACSSRGPRWPSEHTRVEAVPGAASLVTHAPDSLRDAFDTWVTRGRTPGGPYRLHRSSARNWSASLSSVIRFMRSTISLILSTAPSTASIC
jgi:hypothetical protein